MSLPPPSGREGGWLSGLAREEAFEDPEPVRFSPVDSEVHVWLASLDSPPEPLDRLLPTLSHEERTRADGFHFRRDREAYVAGRGLLRRLLGRYLRRPAEEIQFSIGAHGKPSIGDAAGRGGLRFNISHSGGLALFAIASGREVGVDLERIRTDVATGAVVRRFFSSREIAALELLPVAPRNEAFYTCWTRKEAYLKARGDGLARSPESFSVTLGPHEEPALLGWDGTDAELDHWSLRDVRPGPDFAAAVVAEGRDWRLRRWRWPAA